MSGKEIDDALRSMRAARAEDAGFNRAVWREIRHRRALGAEVPQREDAAGWSAWPRWLAVPAAASLVAALLTAWAAGTAREQAADRRSEAAAKALGLGVFGPQAEGLAHNRLVVRR